MGNSCSPGCHNLMMSLMASFYAVVFPTRCLGREIGLDLGGGGGGGDLPTLAAYRTDGA